MRGEGTGKRGGGEGRRGERPGCLTWKAGAWKAASRQLPYRNVREVRLATRVTEGMLPLFSIDLRNSTEAV